MKTPINDFCYCILHRTSICESKIVQNQSFFPVPSQGDIEKRMEKTHIPNMRKF